MRTILNSKSSYSSANCTLHIRKPSRFVLTYSRIQIGKTFKKNIFVQNSQRPLLSRLRNHALYEIWPKQSKRDRYPRPATFSRFTVPTCRRISLHIRGVALFGFGFVSVTGRCPRPVNPCERELPENSGSAWVSAESGVFPPRGSRKNSGDVTSGSCPVFDPKSVSSQSADAEGSGTGEPPRTYWLPIVQWLSIVLYGICIFSYSAIKY